MTKRENKLTCCTGQGTSKLKIRLGLKLSNTMQILEEENPAVKQRPTRNCGSTGMKFL